MAPRVTLLSNSPLVSASHGFHFCHSLILPLSLFFHIATSLLLYPFISSMFSFLSFSLALTTSGAPIASYSLFIPIWFCTAHFTLIQSFGLHEQSTFPMWATFVWTKLSSDTNTLGKQSHLPFFPYVLTFWLCPLCRPPMETAVEGLIFAKDLLPLKKMLCPFFHPLIFFTFLIKKIKKLWAFWSIDVTCWQSKSGGNFQRKCSNSDLWSSWQLTWKQC